MNRPKLYVFRSCFNVWYSLQRYSWLERDTVQENTHGVSDRIEQKYKDFCDVVRYMVIGGLVRAKEVEVVQRREVKPHSFAAADKAEQEEDRHKMKNFLTSKYRMRQFI